MKLELTSVLQREEESEDCKDKRKQFLLVHDLSELSYAWRREKLRKPNKVSQSEETALKGR